MLDFSNMYFFCSILKFKNDLSSPITSSYNYLQQRVLQHFILLLLFSQRYNLI